MHFTYDKTDVNVYIYGDRYRYTVKTPKSIEYRELLFTEFGADAPVDDPTIFIIQDIEGHPYSDVQYKSKCIRCSKPHGVPRKEYNLAPICNRCYSVMEKDSDICSVSSGFTEYYINEDGSKGSVVK